MVTKTHKANHPDQQFVTVPMDSALYADIAAWARSEERSIVSVIRLAIKSYLHGQGVTPSDDTIA